MSDYAAGKVEGQDDDSEAPELAKEILYAQARVHGVVCGSRDMFEDMNRCVEANRVRGRSLALCTDELPRSCASSTRHPPSLQMFTRLQAATTLALPRLTHRPCLGRLSPSSTRCSRGTRRARLTGTSTAARTLARSSSSCRDRHS